MFFSRQDFRWIFALPIWRFTAHEPSVIEEEAQQLQIIFTQVFPQEEVIAQSAIEIFDHGTGPISRSDDVLYGLLKWVKGVSELLVQVCFLLPACWMGQGDILKQKDLSNTLRCDLVLLCQEHEALIDFLGKS